MAKKKRTAAVYKKVISRRVKSRGAGKYKATVQTRKTKSVVKANEKPLCIVGVGASGGGLEAVQAFLTHMPADSGIAVGIVTHLDPTHASIMGDLLTRYTPMSVFQAEDGIKLRGRK